MKIFKNKILSIKKKIKQNNCDNKAFLFLFVIKNACKL